MKWRFWADRGGTFTDVIAVNPCGKLEAVKVLSKDPSRTEDSIVVGIRKLLGLQAAERIPCEQIAEVRVGTTVATNALLERRGSRVLFVTNTGLHDLLLIGDQTRPDLFKFDIQKVPPLYEKVAVTTLRYSADGIQLAPLDKSSLLDALGAARRSGCDSCAICLMHGWRYQEQEDQVASLALAEGFKDVVTSHTVAPVLKIGPRATTTVTEAYVAPVLRRYLGSLMQQLPGVRVLFMKSDGGLTEAGNMAGRDALLSGPAGGMVGAIKTARSNGFEKIIGFDMGGTSTDVSYYGGVWERNREVELAGIRLAIPMLNVETVAAGGGSIIDFDGARLTVGPASAGADPGPACYRQGGPLTVTDCNLLLGRINCDYFPAVFGPEGSESLDVDAVKLGFDRLVRRIKEWTGETYGPEKLAAGALKIAVEHMANAIKRISVSRGRDPRECVLHAFGGAGGQHACAVAEALGVSKILIHPLGGVLSALGIGLASRSVVLEQGIEEALDLDSYRRAVSIARRLENIAHDKLGSDRTELPECCANTALMLRSADGEATFPTPLLDDIEKLTTCFSDAHSRHYGFTPENAQIVISAVQTEVFSIDEEVPWEARFGREDASPVGHSLVWFKGDWRDTPVYMRDDLPRDFQLKGPAVVIDATGTIVIEPGWIGRLGRQGELILARVSPTAELVSNDAGCDPVTLELMSTRFMSIAQEMGESLKASSRSVNVRERLDYSCALFDKRGALIANAPHIPVHLGSMSATVKDLVKKGIARRGDSWVTNDVYAGGTHLPDITVITPVFVCEEEPEFYVASRAHHADIGGLAPGSMPPMSHHIDEEGIFIPFTCMIKAGKWQPDALLKLFKGGKYPSRNVARNIADLRAQGAANMKGESALLALVNAQGLDRIRDHVYQLERASENAVRTTLRKLGAGGRFVALLDNGTRLAVEVRIDSTLGSCDFDFSGTDKANQTNFNAPRAVVQAAILYVLRSLINEPVPLNEGCLNPISIHIPNDSMLDPKYPRAVVAGNVEVSQVLTDALLAALGRLAASQGTMNNLTFGNDDYQYYETIAGGAGAGLGFAGASAVQTHMTNSRLTDPELLEYRFPVVVEEFSIRHGSGGRGAWNGGDGVIRRLRFSAEMDVSILSNRRLTVPFGICGGSPGAPGENYVIRCDGSRKKLNYVDSVLVNVGDAIEIKTPGGGGYGRMHQRWGLNPDSNCHYEPSSNK